MNDRVQGFVTVAHYAIHIEPVLAALPPHLRGGMYAPRPVDAEVRALGIPCESGTAPNPSSMPLLIGGYQDARYGRRPKAMVSHGAAQTYILPDGSPLQSGSFAGGPGHEAIDLFLYPSERACELERVRYPNATATAVGVPKLDAWSRVPNPRNGVIAITFHWNQHASSQVPECGTCWPEWRDTIAALAKVRPVLGHAHPRAAREMRPWWDAIGVEYVPNAADLLPRAEVLVADNTSLLAEWAALDRPVVYLRGSDWTDTLHGLPRFAGEGTLPGPELGPWALRLDPVRELNDAIEASRAAFMIARAASRASVYDNLVDGKASGRAASAIMERFGLA